MRIEGADRKRLLVATAATMLALPLLVRENRAQQGDRPDAVAAVAPGIDLAGPLRGGSGGRRHPELAVTVAAPRSWSRRHPIEIATPMSTSGNTMTGVASYKRLPTPDHGCAQPRRRRADARSALDIDNGHDHLHQP